MKVLVTGATGFVGAHVARLAVKEGHDVYPMVREGSDPWRLEDVAPELHIVRCDLTDDERVRAQLSRIRPELCIHLAWYAEPGQYLDSASNVEMLAASLRMVQALAEQGCRRFVGVGSCFEYDLSAGYLSEDSLLAPVSLYAACKAALGTVLGRGSHSLGMATAWTRLFFLYGPFEDGRRLVPAVIQSLLSGEEARTTDGEQIRDYMHVQDVASAIWSVALSDLSGPVNVGSGTPVAVRDVVNMIGDIVGRPELVRLGALPRREPDPEFVCANNRRLRQGTSWRQGLGLQSGLRNTVDWWRGRVHREA